MIKACFLAVSLFFTQYILYAEAAATAPSSITLAHENNNAYPWVYRVDEHYQGLDITLLQMVAKELDIEIVFEAYPWSRALRLMHYGEVDGVFSSSFDPKRQQFGHYPLKNEQPNSFQRIHTSDYSLYVLKGSKVSFDGKAFYNFKGPIGVQRSFSIATELEKFNAPLSQVTEDPHRILELLALGRISAAALQTDRADKIITDTPELANNIVKFKTHRSPFHLKPYFVMLSKQIVHKHPKFAQQFWQTLAKVRNSKAFAEQISIHNNPQPAITSD